MDGIKPFGSITGSIAGRSTLTGTLTIPYDSASRYGVYEGEYKVTPTDETQVLPTANKILKEDIVIEVGSYINPDDGGIATDDDIDNVIDEVFGEDTDSGTEDPGQNDDNVATDEELDDVITDVFG